MKMKVKRKQAVMLGLIAVFAVLLAITMLTGKPSADGEYTSTVYATVLSLLPPVIAIGLALFTKEVYTSLLAGILAGALLYANGNLELMLNTMLFNEDGGMVSKLSDSKCWNFSISCHAGYLSITVKQSGRFCCIWKVGI